MGKIKDALMLAEQDGVPEEEALSYYLSKNKNSLSTNSCSGRSPKSKKKPDVVAPQDYTIRLPVYKWKLTIPKGGSFVINYENEISWWQRMFFKVIGWSIEPINNDERPYVPF